MCRGIFFRQSQSPTAFGKASILRAGVGESVRKGQSVRDAWFVHLIGLPGSLEFLFPQAGRHLRLPGGPRPFFLGHHISPPFDPL